MFGGVEIMFTDFKSLFCNITLEILKGCGYSCSDCAVDKTFEQVDVPPEDVRDLLALSDDLRENGFRAFEFTLAPTDIISSDSSIATLDHPLVVGLAQRYESLVVSLSLLSDKGLVELAEKIDTIMAGKRFRLILPVTLKNLKNKKYIAALRRRVEVIRDNIKLATFYRVYLTINVMYENVDDFNVVSDDLAQNTELGVWSTVEYTFGHSRKGFNNILNGEEFKGDIAKFVSVLHSRNNTKMSRYIIPNIFDSIELVYRGGNLYYLPVVMEKFPIFDDKFIIPKPWTADAIVAFKEGMYYENLAIFADHKTCGDCCFSDNCSRGDLHTVMRHLNHDECLINMKNRWDLNPKTANKRPVCTNVNPYHLNEPKVLK